MSWDGQSGGLIGVAAALFSEDPQFVKMTYLQFSSAAKAFVECELEENILNPLVKAGVAYLASIDPCEDRVPPSLGELAGAALTLRRGLSRTGALYNIMFGPDKCG